MNHFLFLLRAGLGVAALLTAILPGGTADPPKKDERAAKIDLDELAPHPDLEWLRRAKVPTDDAGLVKYLNGLRGAEAEPAEVERLVGQLQTGSKAEQDAAAAKLAEIGPVAIPVLRRHRLGSDAAASARVRTCLEKIEEAGDKPLARPAMRRLVMRWATAPGTAEALLGYLPFAFDPDAELDAWYGLDELAAKDAKVLAVLAGALADKQPARRAVAACILGRRGDAAQKKAVAGLLKDPGAPGLVRLRAAQGLLAGKDAAGVPTLIDLLTDAAEEVRWQAEELLRWLAVDTAPESVVGVGAPKTCEACQAVWRKWWRDQGEKADVSAAERELRRPLLLLAYERKSGRAWIVGCDGIPRHEWKGLDRLTDARYLPDGFLLATQGTGPVNTGESVVSVRNPQGKVDWTYLDADNPARCQRLPNGTLFVAEHPRVAPLPSVRYRTLSARGAKIAEQLPDRDGVNHGVALQWLPGGWVLRFGGASPHDRFQSGDVGVFDPVSSTRSRDCPLGSHLGNPEVEVTPAGTFLVSNLRDEIGIQYEVEELKTIMGRVWGHRMRGATHAFRLRSGNTLISAPGWLAEVAPDHRVVAEIPVRETAEVARPCLPLVRLGFDAFPADQDLASDVAYRVRGLAHPNPFHRRYALDRLSEMYIPAAGAIADIKKLMADPDPEVRKAADRARVAAGDEAIPKFLAEARDQDAKVCGNALCEVAKYRRGPGVLDALVDALRDERKAVRAIAARILGSRDGSPHSGILFGEEAAAFQWASKTVLPALMKAATDPRNADEDANLDAQEEAVRGVGVLGAGSKPAIELLIAGLSDKRSRIRYRSAEALGEYGMASDKVVPPLIGVVRRSDDWSQRVAAICALGRIGPAAESAIGALISEFDNRIKGTPDAIENLRLATVSAVARIGPTNEKIHSFLLRVLQDPKELPKVRIGAGYSLCRPCRPNKPTMKAVLAALQEWLSVEDAPDRRAIIVSLILEVRIRLAEFDF